MRNYVIGSVLIGILLLSGCTFGSSIEDDLSEVLTEMNNAEEEYRNVQAELKELEQIEQAHFTEMMELSQTQVDELNALAEKVKASLEKRLELLLEEESSMNQALTFVSAFDEIIEKAEEDTKIDVEQLKNSINDRYDYHSTFIEAYKRLSELQRELYDMLTTEGTQLVELQEKVAEVNSQNEIVLEAINLFNESTISVNKFKDEIFTTFTKE